jgi:hypothetical protein
MEFIMKSNPEERDEAFTERWELFCHIMEEFKKYDRTIRYVETVQDRTSGRLKDVEIWRIDIGAGETFAAARCG